MKAGFACAIWMALALMLPAAASAQELTRLGERGLYERFCASCHGVDGRGEGPVAVSLAERMPDLTQLSQRFGRFPAAYVREMIENGSIAAHGPRSMPVWGYELWIEEGADREAEEHVIEAIEMLVRYIRALQQVP